MSRAFSRQTPDTPDELNASETPEPPPEDPARTPLVQARQDDATWSGVVELLQATSVAAVRTA